MTAIHYGELNLIISCSNTTNIRLLYTVIHWAFAHLVCFFVILLLFLWGSKRIHNYTNFSNLDYIYHEPSNAIFIEKYHELWVKRIEMFSFGYFKGIGKDALQDLALEIADYFQDFDLSFTDIIAGLVLVKRKHKQKKEEHIERKRLFYLRQKKRQDLDPNLLTVPQKDEFGDRDELSAPKSGYKPLSYHQSNKGFSKSLPNDSFLSDVNETEQFSTFSLSRESKLSNTVKASLHPVSDTGISQTTVNAGDTVVESNAIHKEEIPDILYFAKYMEMMYYNPRELLAEDVLLQYSSDNKLFETPYIIALDTEWECIVIALRGSYSAADILVDLKISLEEFHIPELGENCPTQYVHMGMHKSAKIIYGDITKGKLLKSLLEEGSKFANYRLVISGHSLGAGVGTLLTYMLRAAGYKDARCYAFSPSVNLSFQNLSNCVIFRECW